MVAGYRRAGVWGAFIKGNGTLLSNDHTVLVSHTANGILTSLTSLYPDRQGQPVSNSYRYYKPDGTSGVGVSFAYWTDSVFDPTTPTPTDTSYNMIGADGRNDPALGAVHPRRLQLGCGRHGEHGAGEHRPRRAQGVRARLARGGRSGGRSGASLRRLCRDRRALCQGRRHVLDHENHGRPDLLPDEPGGYGGYQALFGHKYVAPQITSSLPLTDLSGNVIQDAAGHVGFPGFDGMFPSVTLSYVAQMQEHGVPVTFGYL